MAEENANTFELAPVLDETTGKYGVKNYDANKKIVEDFVAKEVTPITEIADDIALKNAKNVRTFIRKNKDLITQTRIQMNQLLLGDLNAQLKEIETILDNADKALKTVVDTYNTEVKNKLDNKPRVITLTIKGYNEKDILKVQAFATKLGLNAEVK